VDVSGCDMLISPTKPAIGAPIAMASIAATRSLLVFMMNACWFRSKSSLLAADQPNAYAQAAGTARYAL
jgi:hypothetical protein